tara:strand:- start:1370 stop:1663 length:294 start_codon:yes stop_codon:yes gene_type:complete
MDIRKNLSDYNPDAIVWEPKYLDDAIIGITTKGTLVYDMDRLCEIYMEEEGLSEEDAWDHLSYNLDGTYAGEYTPIQIHILNEEYQNETTVCKQKET